MRASPANLKRRSQPEVVNQQLAKQREAVQTQQLARKTPFAVAEFKSRRSSSHSARNHISTPLSLACLFLRLELSFLCRFPKQRPQSKTTYVSPNTLDTSDSALATPTVPAATSPVLYIALHKFKQSMGVSIAAVSLTAVADRSNLTLQQTKGTQRLTPNAPCRRI